MQAATKPATQASTQAATKPVSDPKQTHVVANWKHGAPFIACRFEPTGRFGFATAEDRSIQRWELATAKQIGFAGHDSWVKGLAFSLDGQTLITRMPCGRSSACQHWLMPRTAHLLAA